MKLDNAYVYFQYPLVLIPTYLNFKNRYLDDITYKSYRFTWLFIQIRIDYYKK